MSIADEWHHPDGPVRDETRPNAQDALDFIHHGVRCVLDDRFAEALRASGMSEEAVERMLDALDT